MKRFDDTPGTSRCFWVEKSRKTPQGKPHRKGFPKRNLLFQGSFFGCYPSFRMFSGGSCFLDFPRGGIWLIFVSEVCTLNDNVVKNGMGMVAVVNPLQRAINTLVYIYIYIWSNYSDLTRPGPPNGGLVREIPLFQGNLGW